MLTRLKKIVEVTKYSKLIFTFGYGFLGFENWRMMYGLFISGGFTDPFIPGQKVMISNLRFAESIYIYYPY